MPSYSTLVVLALVASNVSPALSAPIPHVRGQSLSRRVEVPPAAAKGMGAIFKKYGKEFALGVGTTMGFSYLFEKLSGASGKQGTAAATAPEAASETASAANTANNANNQAYSSYSTSTNPGYSSSASTGYSSSTNTGYSSSTNPSYSSSTIPSYSNRKRQATSPDLLGRADLAAAIRLFSRMLDELD